MAKGGRQAFSIFCAYARQDKDLQDKLESHLALLQKEGLITIWHDRHITGGQEWAKEISEHLEVAQIILLLISDAFLASDYCYGVEMNKALAKHKEGSARVIPIILRHVDWRYAPLAHLQALPAEGDPVIGGSWRNKDEAFADIAKGIRRIVLEQLLVKEHLLSDSSQERVNMNDSRKAGDFNFNGPVDHQVIITGENHGHVIGEQHNTYYSPQKDGIRSLEKGSEALFNGDYSSAKEELRIAVKEINRKDHPREASRAHCFLALALLRGELPRVQGSTAMNSIETYMNNALKICPYASYYKIFACIKKDFFENNGYDNRLNEVYSLERAGIASPRCAEDEENEEYFRRCQPLLQL